MNPVPSHKIVDPSPSPRAGQAGSTSTARSAGLTILNIGVGKGVTARTFRLPSLRVISDSDGFPKVLLPRSPGQVFGPIVRSDAI